MAKLCPSYSLCPLIEQKNFLGVSDDGLSGCLIVTLGRNIVIRYRLSDQKQVSSWSSKDKLSAPVVYDSVNKQYIGVFNGDQVAFWQESSVLLNKLKKYKVVFSKIMFDKQIFPLVAKPTNNTLILLLM
ncbi:hypothetical protein AAG570_013482 [Ranatra chinensis]|uniref:Nucleolar protein 11 N-terminal domain-containing protein n=1 Tax=Ranatra chinensis TaxID=642074 RepID=A0ABD0YYP1_9HEMI